MSHEPLGRGVIYDYPYYYDILFGWDRDSEAAFYADAFVQHGAPRGGRVLEVACGTGQTGGRIARMGWLVAGLDVSPAMLEYMRATSPEVETIEADMTSFTVPRPFDAAFNPLSTFRMLPTDADVHAHLCCMAAALVPDGVYLVDMLFDTTDPDDELDEWVMVRDGVTITATTRGIAVHDADEGVDLELDWHSELRPYAPEEFTALVEASGAFAVLGCHAECGHDANGVSQFSPDVAAETPPHERAIVVLRRTR